MQDHVPVSVQSDESLRISYPPAAKSGQVDYFHGEKIADPFRALEYLDDPATAAWISAQNELTESMLSVVPAREQIAVRLRQLRARPAVGVPFERGGRWFQSCAFGLLEQQNVLYVMDAPGGTGRVLLDPNAFSADGTVAVMATSVSPDGAKLAYALAESGSDWLTWRVRDVATGTDLRDVLAWSTPAARSTW
jgi:prolyl oligopeptidase